MLRRMKEFPQALKTWRAARRFSQLALAAEAEVSARHIAFLETGRARPSPEMVARLGDALDLPLDARNRMLAAAGFAPRYPARRWDDAAMAPVRAALAHLLRSNEPFPAFAVDRLWTVVRLNEPAARLFSPLGLAEGGSLLELMASETLPAFIENWPDVAHRAARRLHAESAAQGGLGALDRAAEVLARTPAPKQPPSGPATPVILRLGEARLSFHVVFAQFGAPEDLTLDDLKIELWLPADEATEAALRA